MDSIVSSVAGVVTGVVTTAINSRSAAKAAMRKYGLYGSDYVKVGTMSYQVCQPILNERVLAMEVATGTWMVEHLGHAVERGLKIGIEQPCWGPLHGMAKMYSHALFTKQPVDSLVSVNDWAAAMLTRRALLDLAAWVRCDMRTAQVDRETGHYSADAGMCRLDLFAAGDGRDVVAHLIWHVDRQPDSLPRLYNELPMQRAFQQVRMLGKEPLDYVLEIRSSDFEAYAEQLQGYGLGLSVCLTARAYADMGQAFRSILPWVLEESGISTRGGVGAEVRQLKDNMVLTDKLASWLKMFYESVVTHRGTAREVEWMQVLYPQLEMEETENGVKAIPGLTAIFHLIVAIGGPALRSLNFATALMKLPTDRVALAANGIETIEADEMASTLTG